MSVFQVLARAVASLLLLRFGGNPRSSRSQISLMPRPRLRSLPTRHCNAERVRIPRHIRSSWLSKCGDYRDRRHMTDQRSPRWCETELRYFSKIVERLGETGPHPQRRPIIILISNRHSCTYVPDRCMRILECCLSISLMCEKVAGNLMEVSSVVLAEVFLTCGDCRARRHALVSGSQPSRLAQLHSLLDMSLPVRPTFALVLRTQKGSRWKSLRPIRAQWSSQARRPLNLTPREVMPLAVFTADSVARQC